MINILIKTKDWPLQQGNSTAIISVVFLYFQFKSNKIYLKYLHHKDVIQFILFYVKKEGEKRARKMISSLLSFFRFLTQTHRLKVDLTESVPKVASRQQTSLPTPLTDDEMQKLLLNCDRTCAVGLRDYAILMLLIYLGLRSSEVVNLSLNDINWDNGEIIILGKGSTITRLPINYELKNALKSYLQRVRPNCSSKSFFVSVNKHIKGFKSHSSINRILPYTYRRKPPYIYSENDILKILKSCNTLLDYPLEAKTYYTLLGLMAISGLRPSEALHLEHDSVDMSLGIITIRNSKFRKTRKIPVHKSTLKILQEYC